MAIVSRPRIASPKLQIWKMKKIKAFPSILLSLSIKLFYRIETIEIE